MATRAISADLTRMNAPEARISMAISDAWIVNSRTARWDDGLEQRRRRKQANKRLSGCQLAECDECKPEMAQISGQIERSSAGMRRMQARHQVPSMDGLEPRRCLGGDIGNEPMIVGLEIDNQQVVEFECEGCRHNLPGNNGHLTWR